MRKDCTLSIAVLAAASCLLTVISFGAAQKETLERIVAVLKAKPDWQMTIEGHTDSTGGTALNQALSEKRAQSVLQFLTAAGVPASRLQAVGFGASKPVAPNDTELGRSQNRRVELVKR